MGSKCYRKSLRAFSAGAVFPLDLTVMVLGVSGGVLFSDQRKNSNGGYVCGWLAVHR